MDIGFEELDKIHHSPREAVANAIEKWIEQGELAPGRSVPAEEELSKHFNVARGTVRSGLELLEKRGILKKRNRRRYVSDSIRSSSNVATPLQQTVLLLGLTTDEPMNFKNTGFLQAVQAGALEALSQNGSHAMCMHADKVDPESMKALLGLRPRGVVLFQDFAMTDQGLETAVFAKQFNIPVVVDYDSRDYQDYDRVVADHEDATYLLTKELISRGCKDILCLFPEHDERYWFECRHAGYKRALNEAGLLSMKSFSTKINMQFVHPTKDVFEEKVKLCAGYLLEYMNGSRKPDALLAASDWEVPVIDEACKMFGINSGKDILIAGYDNKVASNPWSKFNETKPFVTVDKNNTELGMALVGLLKQRVAGELLPEPVVSHVKSKLIIL